MVKKEKKFTIAGIFLEQTGRYKWQAVGMVALYTLKQLSDLASPLLYKNFIDVLGGDAADKRPLLVGILALLAVVYYGRVIVRSVSELISNRFQPKVMNDLTERAFRHLTRHSYQFFANNFSGGLVRKIQRLSYAFEAIADTFIYNIIPLFVTFIGSIAIIWTKNRFIALIMAVWMIAIAVVNYAFNQKLMERREKRAAADSEATAVLADSIANSLNVKLFPAYSHEESLVRKVLDKLKRLRTRTWDMQVYMTFVQVVFLASAEISVMYLAIGAWEKGNFSVGDFVLLQMLMAGVWQTLWGLSSVFRTLGEATADAQEMIDIMNAPYDIVDAPKAKKLEIKDGAIVFDRVKFNYNETRTILPDFSLSIKPREKIAFIGPSGAGKSTIVKLLFRFYDVSGGKILIDGQDIAKVTQESLRDAVALVPQDPMLFHRSLLDNIRYGRRDATEKDVMAAAKKAHCHEFISALPEGYATFVGERGIKLSGGQRQRVAIARAILKNAPVLVLDEATSSLDSESEMLIQQALEELMRDKTVIVIAHRLSTIAKMDRIIVMENGKIIDEGTHAMLVKKRGGVYKKLWSIQAGGFMAQADEV